MHRHTFSHKLLNFKLRMVRELHHYIRNNSAFKTDMLGCECFANIGISMTFFFPWQMPVFLHYVRCYWCSGLWGFHAGGWMVSIQMMHPWKAIDIVAKELLLACGSLYSDMGDLKKLKQCIY